MMEYTIGDKIRQIRLALGMQQNEFANRLNINQKTLSHYEVDRDRVPQGFMELLLKELKVNINWLLGTERNMFLPDKETGLVFTEKPVRVQNISRDFRKIVLQSAKTTIYEPVQLSDTNYQFEVEGFSLSINCYIDMMQNDLCKIKLRPTNSPYPDDVKLLVRDYEIVVSTPEVDFKKSLTLFLDDGIFYPAIKFKASTIYLGIRKKIEVLYGGDSGPDNGR